MRLFSFLLFSVLIFSRLAVASVEPGTYTIIDRYGNPLIPDTADPEIKRLDQHLASARKGGELKLSTTAPMDLVYPSWKKGGVQHQDMPYREFIFESLMQRDPRGEYRTLHPHLAESVTVKSDRRTFVINLRPNVTFSDGSPFRASDVLASWLFLKDVENGPSTEALVLGLYGRPTLRVLDDLHVEVAFPDIAENRQWIALSDFLHLTIVKEKPSTFSIPNPYIGTGAYAVTSASRERVWMKRRPDYWAAAKPYFNFDSIRVDSYLSVSITREALKAKEVNFLADTDFNGARGLEQASAGAYYTTTKASRHDSGDYASRAMLLMFNLSKPPLDDFRIRQALVLALDTENAVKNLYGDTYTSLDSLGAASRFRPTGVPSADVLSMMDDSRFEGEFKKPFEDSGLLSLSKIKDRTARIRRAAILLREAGCRMDGGKAFKDGKELKFEVITTPDHERIPQLLQLKETLRYIGIDLSIRQFGDHLSYVKAVKDNKYDLMTSAVPWPRHYSILDMDIIQYWFSSENSTVYYPKGLGLNMSNLVSPALDRIIAELIVTAENSPRFKPLNDALIRFLSAVVTYVPMADAKSIYFFHDRRICVAPRTAMALISAYRCD